MWRLTSGYGLPDVYLKWFGVDLMRGECADVIRCSEGFGHGGIKHW